MFKNLLFRPAPIFLLVSLFLCESTPASQPENIHLFFTGDLQAYLKPCG